MSHTVDYLKEVVAIAHLLPVAEVEQLSDELSSLRDRGGRLFVSGENFPFRQFRDLRVEAYTAMNPAFWKETDALMVLEEKDNLVEAALIRKMPILGITRRAGYAKKFGDCVVVVPDVELSRVHQHTNDFQTIVCNILLSHPALQLKKN